MEEEFFDEDENPSKIKRAIISGASEALKAKKDWKKSDEEIMQDIAERMDELIKEID